MLHCFLLEVFYRALVMHWSQNLCLLHTFVICVITLLKQTAFRNSLTSFYRDTSWLDSTKVFWLCLFIKSLERDL